jgi:integrase/recombinase XerD
MNMKEEIYDLQHQYESGLRLLKKDSRISAENKKIILQYVQDRLALGITKTRAVIIIMHLRRLAWLTERSFAAFEEQDVKKLMGALESRGYSESCKNSCKSVLKTLMRSLGKPESMFQSVKRKSVPSKLRPEDLLTDQEMGAMVMAASDPMWKAILSVFFETGVRPGEILGMRIKDVILGENKAKLYVSGKTEKMFGQRAVYVYQKSYPYLKQWLSIHQIRHDRNSPLWLGKHNAPIKLSAFITRYERISRHAGIVKKNWTYLARHTRLTQFYRDYGSAIGSKLAGHIPGSKEMRTYIHLSESDVEQALDKANGIGTKKKTGEQECTSCGYINVYGEIICEKCKQPLNSAGALVVESRLEKEREELRGLRELLNDPQITTLFQSLKNPSVLRSIKAAIKPQDVAPEIVNL